MLTRLWERTIGFLSRGTAALNRTVATLYALRVPFIVSAVLTLAIAVTGAMSEAVIIATVDRPEQLPPLVIILILLTMALLSSGELMAARHRRDNAGDESLFGRVLRFLPRLVACGPALAVGITSAIMWRYRATGSSLFVDHGLTLTALSVALVAATMLIGPRIRSSIETFLTRHEDEAGGSTRLQPRSLNLIFLGAIGLGVLASLAFFDVPSLWTQSIGPIGVIFSWGIVAIALFLPIGYWAWRHRIPYLGILLVAAFLFSAFDLNDNHAVRTIPTKPGEFANTPNLDLSAWIESRADKDDYEQYPIFIVATEGGATRAAYYTAKVLSAIQDRCPAFAQHIIAISSMSGGSLGGSVFSALASEFAENKKHDGCDLSAPIGEFQRRSRAILSTDLMSPVLAAMLFPDAAQRLLWWPVPEWDRARAIEYAFEDAWKRGVADCATCRPDLLGRDPLELFRAGDTSPVPHLFLNATEVETGFARPIETASTMWPSATDFSLLAQGDFRLDANLTIRNLRGDPKIPLSTAAILSARFPFVTPAGSLGSGAEKLRYVDGGYFENSGSWFAEHLIQVLLQQQRDQASMSFSLDVRKRVAAARFFVLYLDSEACVSARGQGVDRCREAGSTLFSTSAPQRAFGEILSPFRAFINARRSRAGVSRESLHKLSGLVKDTCFRRQSNQPNAESEDRVIAGAANCPLLMNFNAHALPPVLVGQMRLVRTETGVPLSWLLSAGALKEIDSAVEGMGRVDLKGPLIPDGNMTPENRGSPTFKAILCALHVRKYVDTQDLEACSDLTSAW